MHHSWSTAAGVALVAHAVLTAAPAGAQSALTTSRAFDPGGLFLHGHVAGARTELRDADEAFNGYGAGARAGYNLNRYVGVFAGVDYTRNRFGDGGGFDDAELGVGTENDFAVTHLELGGRVNLPIGNALLPYVDVAYARRALAVDVSGQDEFGEAQDGTIRITGDNVVAGGGLQFFFRPTLAFDLGARVSFGDLTDVDVEAGGESFGSDNAVELGTTHYRLTAGLTWYPGALRARQ